MSFGSCGEIAGQNIEPPPPGPHRLEQGVDLVRLTNVHCFSRGGQSAPRHRLDQGVELRPVAAGDDDMRAEPSEQPGDAPPDTAGAARDERHFPRIAIRRKNRRALSERLVVQSEGALLAHTRISPSSSPAMIILRTSVVPAPISSSLVER